MNITIEIAKEFKSWNKHPEINRALFSEIACLILSRYPNFFKVKEFELSVLLTDDSKMQALNHEFRNKDKTTNVLSFPDVEINWRKIVEFKPNTDYMYLGDIAFGYEIITLEAKNKSISFRDHFRHLTIHAILHLIGYDHVIDEDAEAMEFVEVEILKATGVKSPY